MLAWLRRIIVSVGVGGASYGLMLGIMVLSVVYDREFEPVITLAFDTGRAIIETLDGLVSGSYWGQLAVNHLREHDPCRTLSPSHTHSRSPRRNPLELAAGGNTRGAENCHRDHKCSSDGRSCRGTIHIQRSGTGNLCGTIAICRLDLAGNLECAERLR